MQVLQAIQGFLLVAGISDESLLEINDKIKDSSSWMLMRMDPLLKLLSKNMAGFIFIVTRYEYDNKEDNLQKPPP